MPRKKNRVLSAAVAVRQSLTYAPCGDAVTPSAARPQSGRAAPPSYIGLPQRFCGAKDLREEEQRASEQSRERSERLAKFALLRRGGKGITKSSLAPSTRELSSKARLKELFPKIKSRKQNHAFALRDSICAILGTFCAILGTYCLIRTKRGAGDIAASNQPSPPLAAKISRRERFAAKIRKERAAAPPILFGCL